MCALGDPILLKDPDELLTRVIEVELNVGGGSVCGDALWGRELDLGDQVVVFGGGKAAALGCVQEDVVAVELNARRRNGGNLRTGSRCGGGIQMDLRGPPEILEAAKVEDEAHGVCLERDQGNRKADIVTEPEPEGNNEAHSSWRRGWIVIHVTDHLTQGFALLSRGR